MASDSLHQHLRRQPARPGQLSAARRRLDRRRSWPMPESLAMVLWNGKPLVEAAGRAAARPGAHRAAADGLPAKLAATTGETLLFMGLWKETAVFARRPGRPGRPGRRAAAGPGPVRGPARRSRCDLPAADAAMPATAKAMFEWRRRHRHCADCGQPTNAADGGWKRVCPACKAEHFPRTDPVVIMLPHPRRALPAGPPGGLAARACSRPWPGSWSRARASRRPARAN